ncbi:hypothetical protein [Latilactobacillus sakei]|uniref:hypothetical protein n=1 Tax=Latilactobacillus sakei TaxID=1599 RepID=UPI002030BF43|nr:hypothetical protein [Latilactobacillus sakei]MCM1635811.1 hypothetical protein [Latilactobacillus sakei]
MADKKSVIRPSLQITAEDQKDWEDFIGSQNYRTASIMALIRVFMQQHGQKDVLKVLTSNSNILQEAVSTDDKSPKNVTKKSGTSQKPKKETKNTTPVDADKPKNKTIKHKKTLSGDPWQGM